MNQATGSNTLLIFILTGYIRTNTCTVQLYPEALSPEANGKADTRKECKSSLSQDGNEPAATCV